MKEEIIQVGQKNEQPRRAYQKPALNKVALVAGEAVLSTCKNGTGGYDACHYISLTCPPAYTQTS